MSPTFERGGSSFSPTFVSPMRMNSKEAWDFMKDQNSKPTNLNSEWVCTDSRGVRQYFNFGSNSDRKVLVNKNLLLTFFYGKKERIRKFCEIIYKRWNRSAINWCSSNK